MRVRTPAVMQVYFKKIDDSHYCRAMPLRDVLGELLVAGIMAFAACFLVLFMLQGVRKAWPQISLGYMEALSVAVGLAVFGILRFRNIAVVCINTEARTLEKRQIWTHCLVADFSLDAVRAVSIATKRWKGTVWYRVLVLFRDSDDQFKLCAFDHAELAFEFALEFASLTGIPFEASDSRGALLICHIAQSTMITKAKNEKLRETI